MGTPLERALKILSARSAAGRADAGLQPQAGCGANGRWRVELVASATGSLDLGRAAQ